MTGPLYDIALSFAGEQREYARAVAERLRAARVSLFFDEFEQVRLWGADLVEELDRVFRQQARFVLMFVSAAYERKNWTRHERRSALAAALPQRREFVLPLRFDDTDLPGLPPSLSYVDARLLTPDAVASLVLEKLAALRRSAEQDALSLDCWRLVKLRNRANAFDGKGAALFGGRWSAVGTPAVYATSSLSIAVLETDAHDPVPRTTQEYVGLRAHLRLTAPIERIAPDDLPQHWRDRPAPNALKTIGTEWANRCTSCVLSLPSALLPSERVYLLNPGHLDFASLSIIAEEPVLWPL